MQGFGTANYIVLAIYLLVMFAIGLFFSRRQHDRTDFFLAGRSMPWMPVALSMYASLTSATTYLVLPGMGYSGSTVMIVASLASVMIVPLLVLVFYPAYRRMRVTTSYEYIGSRHGPAAHWCVALLFVAARLGWLGTVIYAPALVLTTVTGIPLFTSILIMGALATTYTAMGGLSAVLWTDVVQFVILVGGAIGIAAVLMVRIDGGAPRIMELAAEAGSLPTDAWKPGLTVTALPIVALSFMLQMIHDYGIDQVTVQRLMAIKEDRGVTKAICFNAGSDFLLVALLLFIGLGLHAFYSTTSAAAPTDLKSDAILPYFIMQAVPAGFSGLLITAIFAAAMSSMDSGIHSLSTVVTSDLIEPLRRTPASERSELRLARSLVVGFGALATAVAFLVARRGNILESFMSFMSLFSAPVLVFFLLTIIWKRTHFLGWLPAATWTIAATLLVQTVEFGFGKVNWCWYYPFSVTLCTLLTIILSLCIHPHAGKGTPPSQDRS